MNENQIAQKVVGSFNGVFECLRKGEEYRSLPPRGPPENLAKLTDEELAALGTTVDGANPTMGDWYAYSSIIANVEGTVDPQEVPLPKEEDIADIVIYGIDGSNQKMDYSSFYLLLARASLVNFRYSKKGIKPYFGTKLKDCSGMLLVDGNIFKDEIRLHTQALPSSPNNKGVPVLPIIKQNPESPLLVTYNPDNSNKNPQSQALGWGVKFQQALELSCLEMIDTPQDLFTVVIRDGPLFSNSITPDDNIEGLKTIINDSWKNRILVSCSKRVGESKLLVQALLQYKELRDHLFSGQEVLDKTLKSVATDMILLPKILKPGYRTSLMEAIPRARVEITNKEAKLTPLTCYYYSRTKPHTFIRMEVPKFMWERDPTMVKKAIQIVAWQHELGHKAPLVQLFADKRCQLLSEKFILQQKINLAFNQNDLNFPQEYE